jgi:hypothetical protein
MGRKLVVLSPGRHIDHHFVQEPTSARFGVVVADLDLLDLWQKKQNS